MKITLLMIIIGMYIVNPTLSQLALSELSKIGIIPGRSYDLKLATTSSTQLMVIKLIPNLENMTNCSQGVLNSYQKMLTRVLEPIDSALKKIKSAVTDKPTEELGGSRFWGALIGGVALTVATSAQITAGVALHNSIQNANAIHQLKDSIRNSNKAIAELQTAAQQTVVVLNALQDQINNQLVPSINTLGCQVVANTLGLKLNQYFSEISLVFGPNLRDPTSETLSIQALSRAFNGDFDSMLNKLKYDDKDFLDLLESDSIRGRIIDVSLSEYLIIIQIEYPSLIAIKDATIQMFNLISYNYRGSEWLSIFPSQLLIRGTYISNIDISQCTMTTNSIICKSDTSSPISSSTWACANGNLTGCARTRIVNSHAPRFALSGGVIYANCAPMVCQCQDPYFNINQEPSVTNVMIGGELCKEVFVGGVYITLGVTTLPRAMYAENVSLGGQISVDPIDLGNEISSIQDSVNKSQEYLDYANSILERVNPNIINVSTFSYLLVASILLLIWCIITFIWLLYLTKNVAMMNRIGNMGSRSSTVNSLSGFVG
ncbi:fusion protein [Wufeng Apodemus chevrieri jeilongvirus 1]|uniref:Fusion glycoprotein F0 n=1 Tax=Wufeng Apodemus chevrieri jeilongvirus 1 TaxID=2928987 RepID=A0A8T9KLF1_9MONO|nr:fusion protein [Wufeng Apodemus chevrieri jeilongvirus 1]WPV62638.1 MAG: fusion protein [Wufeng rodent jeilongvirus 4]